MKYKDIELYKQLHIQNPSYGNSGKTYVEEIGSFIKEVKANSILDFGSGKGSLSKALKNLNIATDEYDPAIEGKETPSKRNYDLLITTDVLEHLYEDELEPLFKEMLDFEPRSMYHVVCTRGAFNMLPDGTNAHKTIKESQWWRDKLDCFFKPHNFNMTFKRTNDITHYLFKRAYV